MAQKQKEKHIFNSVSNALKDFQRTYDCFDKGSIHLYIDKAESTEPETERLINAGYQYLSLRHYENMWVVMHNVVHAYNKIGKRNNKKDDNHLNKQVIGNLQDKIINYTKYFYFSINTKTNLPIFKIGKLQWDSIIIFFKSNVCT